MFHLQDRMGEIDMAFIDGFADDRAAHAQLCQGMQIIDTSHAARCKKVKLRPAGLYCLIQGKVWSGEHSVARDIGAENGRETVILISVQQIPKAAPAFLLPCPGENPRFTRIIQTHIESSNDAGRPEMPKPVSHTRGLLNGEAADYDALNSTIQKCLDNCLVAYAAPDLQFQGNALRYAFYYFGLAATPFARAVEIYDMKPFRSGFRKTLCLQDRIVFVDSSLRKISLRQAHTLAVPEIDGGKNVHVTGPENFR
jgi:hypothetical protein